MNKNKAFTFDPKKEHDKLYTIVENIIKKAKHLNADGCEVVASCGYGLTTSVRMQEVDTVEFHQDQGLTITTYFGQKKGSATSSDFLSNSLDNALQAACDIAKFTNEDPCSGLAKPELMADPKKLPDLDLYHPWEITTEQAIQLAKNCEQAGLNHDSKITNSEGATVNTSTNSFIYGNSNHFIHGYTATRHSISAVLIAKEQQDMQRDYWYTVNRNASQLTDANLIGKKAAIRAINKLNSRKIKTCKSPIIFTAEVASSLISSFLSAISGSKLYRDASFLTNSLNKTFFPTWFALSEQPLISGALGSASFDGDGLATWDKFFVDNGVIKNYILDTYSARKLGMQSTANAGGVHNIIVQHNMETQEELLSTMDTGLLLTELMGHGVNLVTGDYSQGAAGFWVEKGQIQYPVSEITIAGNLKDMFKNMIAVGHDIDYRSNIRTGSILIDEMAIAGN